MNLTNLLTADNQHNKQQASCFAYGTVVQNDSAEYPGCVKVHFPLSGDGNNISTWIPCLTSSAGLDYGSYCCPEVDTQVICGFMDNNPDCPFVIGCVYPATSNMLGANFDSNNFKKSIRTKSGVECTIHDEEGKQYVEIKTASGAKLRMDDGSSSVSISDKDNNNHITLSFGSGDIEVVADKKITLRAGNAELVLSADTDSISLSGAQITLESSRSLAVISNNMLEVEGGITSLKGRQTLKCSAQIVRIN